MKTIIRTLSMFALTLFAGVATSSVEAQFAQPLSQPNRLLQSPSAQRLPAPMPSQPRQQPSNRVQTRVPNINQGFDQPVKVRVKDITTVAGHRSNRISGMGLITGLKGTGSRSPSTAEVNGNVLQNYDVLTNLPATGSTSVVMVTAELPPFAKPGQKISATVAVFDDATSLYGGVLIDTPLKGPDGEVYAIASGNTIIEGFSAEGAASSLSKNHDTTGKVFATVELEVQQGPAFPGASYRLILKNRDYTTAFRIAQEINRYFPQHARPIDSSTVEVFFPQAFLNSKMSFVVGVEDLRVVPDNPATVVINQKTGTIVAGKNVRLSQFIVSNGNLIVSTNETPEVSQPLPFSDGETVVVPRTQISATETGNRFQIVNPQTTVGDLATALNMLGVSPQDLINIFHDIDRQGALQAQLIIQ